MQHITINLIYPIIIISDKVTKRNWISKGKSKPNKQIESLKVAKGRMKDGFADRQTNWQTDKLKDCRVAFAIEHYHIINLLFFRIWTLMFCGSLEVTYFLLHLRTILKMIDFLFSFYISLMIYCWKASKSRNAPLKRGMVMMGNLTHVENWNWKKRPKIGWNKEIVDGLGWYLRIFNLTHQKEVRGQSWPQRSLQKHVKITSNYILVDCLGWYFRIFNLTRLQRSEAKVDLGGHFKNMSKWLQITYLWMVWNDIQDYSIWPTTRGQRPKSTSEVA